jgi:hypothetical protein
VQIVRYVTGTRTTIRAPANPKMQEVAKPCLDELNGNPPGSCACVVLCLCGLPGTGKSSVANVLMQESSNFKWGLTPEAKQATPRIHHVCFDEYEDALASSSSNVPGTDSGAR